MTRQHGSNCRVYYGGRDASGDIVTITPEVSADTHDTTVLTSGGWKAAESGLSGWSASLDAFHDAAEGGIGQQLEDLLGASGGVLSIFDGDAKAIGDKGVLYPEGILTQRGEPINVADMIKLSGTIQGSGRPGLFGVLLHPLGEETETAGENSVDNSESTANGGRASLHVTAVTGSWTIKVEHSANNIDWADLVTFTQATAATGPMAESVEIKSGTINRYLRVTATEDVAGSITYVAGFARY